MSNGFDAGRVAEQAAGNGDVDVLAVVVTQMAGYVSACWENLSGAGVFQSERAAAAVDSTLGWLRSQRQTVTRLGAGDRLLVASAAAPAEVAAGLSEWFAGSARVGVVNAGAVVVVPAEAATPEIVEPTAEPERRETVANPSGFPAEDVNRLLAHFGVRHVRVTDDELVPPAAAAEPGSPRAASSDAQIDRLHGEGAAAALDAAYADGSVFAGDQTPPSVALEDPGAPEPRRWGR